VSVTTPAHTTFYTATPLAGGHPGVGNAGLVFWQLGDFLPPESGLTQASGALTLVVQVDSPILSGTLLHNVVAISDTSGLTDSDEITTPAESAHSLSVSKSASPSPVAAGGLLTYTIAYTVSGNEPALGATISDTVLQSTTYQSCDPSPCSDTGGVVTWSLGDVNSPASGLVTLTVLIDTPLISGTLLVNRVTISDTSGLSDSDEITTPVESSHALSLSKSASPSPVAAGGLLTYTIAYTVSGNEPALGTTISDTVPQSTTYQTCYGGLSCGGPAVGTTGLVTWYLNTVSPPDSGVVTLVVLVDSPLLTGTVLHNAVLISDTSGLTDTDEITTPVMSDHALSVSKSASPSPATAGDLLTYTIEWEVTGNEPAFGVTISDTVPQSSTYQACSGGLSCTGPAIGTTGLVAWYLNTVNPPDSGVVTLAVQVDASLAAGVVLTNGVIITDTDGLTDTDEITTPVEAWADLTVVKSDDPDPVIVGTPLTYTLVVTNNGPSEAVGVVLTDTLPPEVSFVGATPSPSSTMPLTWFLGTMAPGQMRRFTVTVQVSPHVMQTFTNFAVVGSDTPDDYPDDNDDEEPTTPLVPGLEMVKTVAPGEAARDQPIAYTIRITNTGQVTFDPLVLTDTLPPDFHYIAGSGNPSDPDTIAEPTLVWQNVGPLAPGASRSVIFAVTARPTLTGTYANAAIVQGHHSGGIITDTDDVPVVIEYPAVVLDKEIAGIDTDILAPNYVTFTIAITNVGPSAIGVLPLLDQYDPYYLSFHDAMPYPEQDADDGLLTWNDLTGPAPHGFNRNLSPGEPFFVTAIFQVAHDINITITNIATITGVIDVYGNPANEDDDEVKIGGEDEGIPTPVELLYFRAVAEESTIRLAWATAAEVGTAGFHAYRAVDEDFAHAEPIAYVPATGGGSAYVYVDRDVTMGQTYWYWLADVSTGGTETFHGPVRGSVGIDVWPYRLYLPLVLRNTEGLIQGD
jgi:uncharacterized repeat protein (TIGR01451 family)